MSYPAFVELRRNCKKDKKGCVPYNIAILGDCATQHLAAAIEGYAFEEGYDFHVYEADYNQIDMQIIDRSSGLYASNPQSILIYMCSQRLYESYCAMPEDRRSNFAETVRDKICNYWDVVCQTVKVNILQTSFLYENDEVYGNYALKIESSFPYQLIKLNYLLVESARKYRNVFWIDMNHLQGTIGKNHFLDTKMYYIAKMAVSTEALPLIAKSVLDIIKAVNGRLKKCVVLDLDNTLWGGVIGEDGIENIQIGELGQGHAFTDFQIWLKELKKRGILLTVCSKNDACVAQEPFISHPEMVLRLEDFSMFVSNWEDKASNIRHIQEQLNIGMDSIVFIDDNPFERNLVRTLLPAVAVPELPDDPALYVDCLKQLDLFETASYSDEDSRRTQQYRAELNREQLKQEFKSFDRYLEDLQMEAVTAPFDSLHYSRIAQLTQRSNQFNLRTIRYTDAEIEKIANDDQYITMYACLKDKFGDYGLVGVVILEKISETELFINEWLMSCRVLKRGMEEFIANRIVDVSKENGFHKILGEYIRTPKNQLVSTLYSSLGFLPLEDNRYELNVDTYGYKKTYIK